MGKLIKRTTTTVEEEFVDDDCGLEVEGVPAVEETMEAAVPRVDDNDAEDEDESGDGDDVVAAAEARGCSCPPGRVGTRGR